MHKPSFGRVALIVARDAGRSLRDNWKRIVRTVAVSAGVSLSLGVVYTVPIAYESGRGRVNAVTEGQQLGGNFVAAINVNVLSLELTGALYPSQLFYVIPPANGEGGPGRAFASREEAVTALHRAGLGEDSLAVLDPSIYSNPDSNNSQFALTDSKSRPAYEMVASDGTVLYRSSELPSRVQVATSLVDFSTGKFEGRGYSGGAWWSGKSVGAPGVPELAACEVVDASRWKFGSGDLAGTARPANPDQVRVCYFRSTAQLEAGQRSVLISTLQNFAGAPVFFGGLAFPVVLTLAGGVHLLRRRIQQAAAADIPTLVEKPRLLPGFGGIVNDVNLSMHRAQRSIEQQQAFVSDAAHELRSPLAGLITTLEVAQRFPHLVSHTQVTDTSLTQARRLERLTQDLLVLAKVDARSPIAADVVDLVQIVTTVLASTPHLTKLRHVDLEEFVPVLGSEDSFSRVIQNLVDNANRYAATAFDVSVRCGDGSATVTVSNDGPPIAPQDQERIFERFTRVGEDRNRASGGTGLGLAIARGVAERYGGTLTVRSGHTSGTSFIWTAPTAQ